jgi:hypothetical protein
MTKALLITGPGKRIPVTVKETDTGTLVISQGHRILFGLKPMDEVAGELAEKAVTETTSVPAGRLNPRSPNWEWLTPAKVIEYFKSSPILRAHAPLVESILGPHVYEGQAALSQLDLDLEAVRPYLDNIIQDGSFVYGYQSRIAEALNIPNQGSYRRRIKNVATALARQLDSTSTTGPGDLEDGAKQRAA